ncbi:MAG TPA: transcription antitermination factor NusB [Burkholderiales bacterium]|nr:transcription antitermination factor NusB [Burkholderiales bacterium]
MGNRRKARECALQILFELEFNPADPQALVRRYWKQQKAAPDVREYAGWLVGRILDRRGEIDAAIQAASKNWRLARMGVVDRNILRIAVCELVEDPSLAPAIVINEAIEIAKRYSGQESATFVNGVLDAVRRRGGTGRAPRAGTAQEGHHEQDRGHQRKRTRTAPARRAGD